MNFHTLTSFPLGHNFAWKFDKPRLLKVRWHKLRIPMSERLRDSTPESFNQFAKNYLKTMNPARKSFTLIMANAFASILVTASIQPDFVSKIWHETRLIFSAKFRSSTVICANFQAFHRQVDHIGHISCFHNLPKTCLFV